MQKGRQKRPSFPVGRHRPRSFHGRGARRMEVLGEEDMEYDDSVEMQHNRISPRPKTAQFPPNQLQQLLQSNDSDTDKEVVVPARPKSAGGALRNRGHPAMASHFAENDLYPLPQVTPVMPAGAKREWSAQARIWRERREYYQICSSPNQSGPYPSIAGGASPARGGVSALGTMVVGSAMTVDLPHISAQPRRSERPHRPLPQRRPFSEILTHKSTPDMRSRYYRDNPIAQPEFEMAERVSPSPRMNPVISKRRQFLAAEA